VTNLPYAVMVHDGLTRHREQRLPDGSPNVSSPVSSTQIFGENDAVLVDPPFTRDQVHRVGDWVQESGKNLTYVYATHGHGDHWFGTDLMLQRFTGVTAYVTEGTIAKMHHEACEGRARLWDVDFPGQIPRVPLSISRFPPTVSNWKASLCMRSRSVTRTPMTQLSCTCRP
jgi:glyoxylase-like metal-dependent hydrolase (beta-lactamase superfamily II)